MVQIIYEPSTRTFHLRNDFFSYIMTILPEERLGQVYFGRRLHHRKDFSHLVEYSALAMAPFRQVDEVSYSQEHQRQEYPVYGASDMRDPACEVLHPNGSRLSDFRYAGYTIAAGKPTLPGLPATYVEDEGEAMTLTITLRDPLDGLKLELLYTVFDQGGILARSVRFVNEGAETLHLTRAMSLSLDLPGADYAFVQFSGQWGRERYKKVRMLEQGIQSVGSLRGQSSHNHNPFLILQRPGTDEQQGECIGLSLVYSGNFLAQAEVSTHDETRVLLGIHPHWFDWALAPGERFQTPEAVMVYTDRGLNHMSQTFHRLYLHRLARGYWRDRPRPILLNNWEATYFDITEDKLLSIAAKAKECGVELFVLDDGWFGGRRHDHAGLGDWVASPDVLPDGITGLAERIEGMGLKFGLWFEPEMVNEDSDLYREHPDWILQTPGRPRTVGRFQHVLDFSRPEVVDRIYEMMAKILSEAKVSYVKWDMNRSITECYSAALPPERQGEVFHRYILGVYDLYERLTNRFPEVLFESCASGGGRFDPGLLYYAPQAWTSDDSDAIERLKIQYGTSYCYPIVSMGTHVSVSPNHQVGRETPLDTRANVAYFGTFGYELDLNRLSDEEQEQVKEQIRFMKTHRALFQFGTFYRLLSPFEGDGRTAWMVVSEDRREAIVGVYKVLNGANVPYSRLVLQGLDPDLCYHDSVDGLDRFGDELMSAGLITTDGSTTFMAAGRACSGDFTSLLYHLTAVDGGRD